MKNKNKRELEKHWAREAAKKTKPAKKKKKTTRPRDENLNQAAGRIVRESQREDMSQAAARILGEETTDE